MSGFTCLAKICWCRTDKKPNTFRGRPVADMTKEELIEVFEWCSRRIHDLERQRPPLFNPPLFGWPESGS